MDIFVLLTTMLVCFLIGMPIALISAVRPGSRLDTFGTLFALGGVAIPSFFEALLLMYVFAVLLHWLPPSGYTSPLVDPVLSAKMLFMPAVVLGTHSAAVIMRQGAARGAAIKRPGTYCFMESVVSS